MQRMNPIEFARHLRQSATTYEQLMWYLLRNRKRCKMKFRRQHPIGPYTADFYCAEAELVIEIDGKDHFAHEGEQKDAIRDRWMSTQGIRVLRFTGKQVEMETNAVCDAIDRALIAAQAPHPQPLSPKRGEGSLKSSLGRFSLKRGEGSLGSDQGLPAKRRGPGLGKNARPAFLLVLVLVVIAMASLAALNFSQSMLISHETARLSGARLQARMCAESGVQSIRLFLASPRVDQTEQGGTWNNAGIFQALNVIPNVDPARRGNFSVIAPNIDEFGNFTGIRYGLQNESAKLNLNTLSQLDALSGGGAMAGSAADGGEASLGLLASEVTSTATVSLATDLLMALPGMTEDIADAILDFLDEDDEPRPYGAEYDYYAQMQPPYEPANGPINSVEQLLAVRGITPALLFGYDENRNGMLDQGEMTKMNSGQQPGLVQGAAVTTDPDAVAPPALGWAPFLTLHSQEKNVSTDGLERININSDDLDALYEELVAVLGNETWASFIVAYRIGGTPGGDGTSPLVKLASMAAAESESLDGALGAQLDALNAVGGDAEQATGPTEPWTVDALGSFDLTQEGSVQFNQVLDLIDATVTIAGQGAGVTLTSPLTSLPLDMANSTPLLMNYLTTVDTPALPGRINIMECPREILAGIPGLSEEVVEQILEARNDGSESETRSFETWLAIEGYVTIDEMRAILPLVTCGGDVYKAQIIGYLEGNAAFSRIEAIINGAGDIPKIQFFRRMDHLGRGFDIATLGQRFDAGLQSGMSR